jgi:DNA-directed RNA polymerase specialized sigma24 family protein
MTENLSVHELLVQLKHGNINALGVLYARYAIQFYWRARGRGLIHEDAEDIVHTVFWDKIFKHIDTYDELRPAGAGWMWRICYNAINDLADDPHRRRVISVEIVPEDAVASVEADPSVWHEDKEYYAARYCAWKSLSPADQEILRTTKRGRRSNEWKAAQKRLLAALDVCLKQNS